MEYLIYVKFKLYKNLLQSSDILSETVFHPLQKTLSLNHTTFVLKYNITGLRILQHLSLEQKNIYPRKYLNLINHFKFR